SITTGEGGMVTTASDDLAALVASLRDHGASQSDRERHESSGGFLLSEYEHLGFNFRLTDIQGALGSAQMDRADEGLEGSRRCAARYADLLAGLDWRRLRVVPDGYVHGYQVHFCLFKPEGPSTAHAQRRHELRSVPS